MKKSFIYLSILAALLTALFGLASCGQTVEFNVNFIVDGETYSTVGTGGEEVIAIPENPTKEGYTFDGWYWDKDTWQTPFTANSLLDAPLSSDMNVYAKWKENEPPLPDLQGVEIRSKALTLTEDTLKVTLSNATETFSFLNDITVADGASYVVARDIGCEQTIASKTVSLEAGDNVYYILVTNGNEQKLYTATVRRRPMYTVSFNTKGGTAVASQTVEEGSLATEPTTTRAGYTFASWNYDFSQPVTSSVTVSASWNYTNTPESEDNGGGTSTQAPPVTGKTPESDANGVIYTNYGTYYSVTAFKPVSQNSVELVIPATFNGLPVKSIGMRAFAPSAIEQNTVITKITVSEGITDIESSAFAECVNMTEISLPSTVTSIDRNAFARCQSLVSVTIPAGVTEIGVSIFEDCKKLEQINVAAGNPNFASADGDLYSKDMKTLIRYAPGKNATTYTVKAGVTTIATGCFQATRLTEVNLSAEICRIEAVAFENCASLTKVTVPSVVSNNWWFSNFKDAANGWPIPTGEMNNPSTLSTYLKSTYLRYYFNRTV